LFGARPAGAKSGRRAIAPRQEAAEAPRWSRRLDTSISYSPHAATLTSGLAALWLAPSRGAATVMVVGGVLIDALASYWDRRRSR
jgi:hypothetical protein